MASLVEQKDHTLRLVDKVDELAGGLGDMEVRNFARNTQSVVLHRTNESHFNECSHARG